MSTAADALALPPGRWVPNRRGIVVRVADRPTAAEVARLKTRLRNAKRAPSKPEPSIAPDEAIMAAAEALGVHPTDLFEHDRARPTANARAVAMWVMHRGGHTSPAVGRVFHRDHTTVLYNVRRVERDAELLAAAERIRGLLTQGAAA